MSNCVIGGENCNIGQNVVVSPQVVLGKNVKVQNNVSIYTGVICEDDVFLGPSMVFTNVINPPRSAVNRKSEYAQTLVKKRRLHRSQRHHRLWPPPHRTFCLYRCRCRRHQRSPPRLRPRCGQPPRQTNRLDERIRPTLKLCRRQSKMPGKWKGVCFGEWSCKKSIA